MIEILIFIIVLSVLILSHEFGHFIVAKLSNMRVDEFGLGFPPKIASFKKGETKYVINLIPFGGYVKIYGEEAEEENGKDINKKADHNRKFSQRPKLAQASVIMAGVFFNFLLAWLLFSIGFMSGFPTAVTGETLPNIENRRIVVTSVLPDSPAEIAGLKAGSEIVAISNGKEEYVITSTDEVSTFIEESDGIITLNTKFGNEVNNVDITPSEGILENKKAIGITMDEIGIIKLPIHLAVWNGLKTTINLTKLTIYGIGGIIGNVFTGKGSFETISGPIGIYNLVGDAYNLGFIYLLGFTALISISLGVINLAPFPALDGGRLVILIIESIKKSPLNASIVNGINYFGFFILIILMIIISYGDILKLGIFH